MREEARRWRELQSAKETLEDEVATWKARFKAEAARADELAADVARLSAALMTSEADAAAYRHRAQEQAAQQPQTVSAQITSSPSLS